MPSQEDLARRGHGWIFQSTVLAELPEAEVAAVLELGVLRDYAAGEVLVHIGEPARSVELILDGEVQVSKRRHGELQPVAHLGPGHLFGERSLLREEPANAVVRSLSPVSTLQLDAADFRALLRRFPSLRDQIERLVEVRDRSEELIQLLIVNRQLRSVGRSELEQLLQSATLMPVRAGTAIVRAGEPAEAVYVVVNGVGQVVDAEGSVIAHVGRGGLFGHRGVLLGRPRSATVLFEREGEVLRIGAQPFESAVYKNRGALHSTVADLSRMRVSLGEEAPRARLVVLYGAEQGLGATTLAYGLAHALGGERVLVDLDGERSAQRLGRDPESARVGSVAAWRLRLADLDVYWPRSPDELGRLVPALMGRGGTVLLSASRQGRASEELVRQADVIVFVSRDAASHYEIPARAGQFRVHAVRLRPGQPRDAPAVRHEVRILDDPRALHAFWRDAELARLVDPQSTLGRSCLRLGRVLEGRTVGLALGGGGAWGFAHVGLIRTLHRHQIPIDYVAGASFGAVVAGLYAAGGLPALEELVRRGARLYVPLARAVFRPNSVQGLVDTIVGSPSLGETEIPVFPVAADIADGSQVILRHGTVGAGVQSSSGMPGLFSPWKDGSRRLVDGGVVNNVPASVAWEAGSDFIIASNVIPRAPGPPTDRSGVAERLGARTLARVDDLVRSVFLLMWRNSVDRGRESDYVFDFPPGDVAPHEFHRGREIAARAEEVVESHLEALRRSMAEDATTHRSA